jgi:hypothetical protein
MSGELDLIRTFRAEDAVLDAGSQENARAALLEHIAASTDAPPRKRWGWLGRRSHPVATLLVGLVITGGAAAAVVSLAGSASQPLVGRVPGAITPASVAGYNYTIAVTPELGAGVADWQSWIVYSRPGTSGLGGGGATLPSLPIFDAGGPVSVARRGTIAYVLTSPQVFAVRIGSRMIRTISSALLPTGDRAAVFFLPDNGPGFMIPGVPAGPPPSVNNVPTLVPLDRFGRVIRTQVRASTPGPPPLTWMASDAVRRRWPLPGFAVPYQGAPNRPRPGVCQLAQHGLRGLHVQFGHTIAWISPVHDEPGEVFLSCVDAEYYLDGWPLQAAVLLDGHRPGRVLGPIPGARPVPGQPGIVDVATGRFPSSLFTRNYGITAKRVGNAWLVVQGGSGLAQRVQALHALRISKLDLHHRTPRQAAQ